MWVISIRRDNPKLFQIVDENYFQWWNLVELLDLPSNVVSNKLHIDIS